MASGQNASRGSIPRPWEVGQAWGMESDPDCPTPPEGGAPGGLQELSLPPRLVLFDGVCGLCNRSIDFLVRADRRRLLRYAPLQGETVSAGVRIRERTSDVASTSEERGNDPAGPPDSGKLASFSKSLETIVFVDEGEVFVRSRAVFRITRYLPWPYRMLSWFRWLPVRLTDAVYRWIAVRRYELFGKRDVCRIPTPEERQLFLP